jgi:hypothetical protein
LAKVFRRLDRVDAELLEIDFTLAEHDRAATFAQRPPISVQNGVTAVFELHHESGHS